MFFLALDPGKVLFDIAIALGVAGGIITVLTILGGAKPSQGGCLFALIAIISMVIAIILAVATGGENSRLFKF